MEEPSGGHYHYVNGEAIFHAGAHDLHAWQSVENARIYVASIADAFCSADTEGCPVYEANAALSQHSRDEWRQLSSRPKPRPKSRLKPSQKSPTPQADDFRNGAVAVKHSTITRLRRDTAWPFAKQWRWRRGDVTDRSGASAGPTSRFQIIAAELMLGLRG